MVKKSKPKSIINKLFGINSKPKSIINNPFGINSKTKRYNK